MSKIHFVTLIGVLLATGLILVFAQRRVVEPPNTRPRRTLSNKSNVIRLNRGGNLQRAIADAQLGDTIELAAGAAYMGPIMLPNKVGGTGTDADFITIRTSDQTLPGEGVRVGPGDAGKMAAIVSPGSALNALKTAPGAHHYKFIGIEFRSVDATAFVYDLLFLGDVGANQNTLAQVPHHLVFDRCYIHAFPTQSLKRGIALNSAETSITNSYISGFKVVGQEAQAILGWNGPGPFHIINNYLEAAGENILFGGADPSIPNLVPSDIEIRRNYLTKQRSWYAGDPSYAGVHWTVKNVFELKNARRVTVDGNVMEHNWADAQDGTGVLFTVRNQDGTAPWSTVEDVTFTNNVVRHMAAAINILGTDYIHPSQVTSRVTIRNNLFYDINGAAWGGNGTFLAANGGTDITFDHNTVLQSGNIILANANHTRFVFKNNIVQHNAYGIIGTGHAPGNDSINTYFPGSLITANAIIAAGPPPNGPYLEPAKWYPAGNYYLRDVPSVAFTDFNGGDYRLLAASPYSHAATDGKDVGCDIDALNAAIIGVAPSTLQRLV